MTDFIIAPTLNGKVASSIKSHDPLNRRRTRNDKTVKLGDFNCGGYALETYNWFLPNLCSALVEELAWNQWYDEQCFDENEELEPEEYYEYQDFKDELIEAEYQDFYDDFCLNSKVEISEETLKNIYYDWEDSPSALKYAVEAILSTFSDVRQIKDFSELKEDEYGIAYAIGGGDFHFVKYDQLTDVYTHKQGYWPVESIKDCDEAFLPRYDSERIYFAKKRGK